MSFHPDFIYIIHLALSTHYLHVIYTLSTEEIPIWVRERSVERRAIPSRHCPSRPRSKRGWRRAVTGRATLPHGRVGGAHGTGHGCTTPGTRASGLTLPVNGTARATGRGGCATGCARSCGPPEFSCSMTGPAPGASTERFAASTR